MEDDPIQAEDLARSLEARGYDVQGPFGACDEAERSIGSGRPDFALLDHLLAEGTSEPIQHKLAAMHVPFAVISGENPRVRVGGTVHHPVVPKPIESSGLDQLLDFLSKQAHASGKSLPS